MRCLLVDLALILDARLFTYAVQEAGAFQCAQDHIDTAQHGNVFCEVFNNVNFV